MGTEVSTTDELVGMPSFGDVVVETEGEGGCEGLDLGFGVLEEVEEGVKVEECPSCEGGGDEDEEFEGIGGWDGEEE